MYFNKICLGILAASVLSIAVAVLVSPAHSLSPNATLRLMIEAIEESETRIIAEIASACGNDPKPSL